MFHRSRLWLLKAAIALFAGVAFLQGSAARADYSLFITVTDNHGNSSGLVFLGGPFGAAGGGLYSDLSVTFPEFTSLTIVVTANESATDSFLNQVQISGVAKKGFSATTLSVDLLGTSFDSPIGAVNATETIASSALPGSFTSASIISTLNGSVVGPAGGLALPIPTPSAAISAGTIIVLPALYDAEQKLSVGGIVQNGTNAFNLTGKTDWTTVPEPASLLLVLTGLPVFGAGWLRRRHRKE